MESGIGIVIILSLSFFECIVDDIIPIIVKRLHLCDMINDTEENALAKIKEVYRKMSLNESMYTDIDCLFSFPCLVYNPVFSIDLLMQSVERAARMLEQDVCIDSAPDMANVETYASDKYARNYKAKQKYRKKNQLRKRCRKYGVKSSNKRINNKMRKYKINFSQECYNLY